jgi:hypothetical protein
VTNFLGDGIRVLKERPASLQKQLTGWRNCDAAALAFQQFDPQLFLELLNRGAQ